MIEIDGVEHIEHLRSVDSTNTLARREAESSAGLDGVHVWIADEQTAGRGRHGRSWHSPGGRGNLYATIAIPSRWSLQAVPRVTLAAGVALVDAIADLGIEAALEWPNDLVIGRAKVAGILAEGVLRGDDLRALIVGVGVNVGGQASEFPGDLEHRVTTLREHAPESEFDEDASARRWRLLRAFVRRLLPLLDTLENPAGLLADWRRRARLPARVRLADGREGDAVDVDAGGRLLVSIDQTLVSVESGALEWLR